MTRFLKVPEPDEQDEDPLAGIANLFDVSVVFIVGLMISLFSIYRMGDLLDPQTEVTMVKTNKQGQSQVVIKKGTEINAYRVTGEQLSGDGERLGTAYRLANGQIIYVPDATTPPPAQ
jgi:hypothetical protein